MKVGSILPHRWRTQRDATRHNEAIRGVLDTPPIRSKQDGLVLFSMIGTATLLPYLVALKSLWQQIGRGRVAILDDGTLTAQDRAILAHHCGDPELLRGDMVECGPFPKGRHWERFLTILDRRAGEYWLQIDSGTVTLGSMPEVEQAIATNRSFTLPGDADAEAGPLPLAEFTRRFYPNGSEQGQIQAVIESRLDKIPAERGWRYLRGSTGFSGFAAGGPGRELAGAFLAQALALAGEDGLAELGSEQVAANFHIANEPAPVPLPHARYLEYRGEQWGEDVAFVHFTAPYRFSDEAHTRASQQAIDRLTAT